MGNPNSKPDIRGDKSLGDSAEEDSLETFPSISASTISSSLVQVIETLGKLSLLVGALCFVCGILITNIYLRQFGFSEFSLLRTRFILTGAILIFPFAVLVGMCWIFVFLTSKHQRPVALLPMVNPSGHRRPIRTLLLFLALVVYALGFLILFYSYLLGMNIRDPGVIVFLAPLLAVAASLGILNFLDLLVIQAVLSKNEINVAKFQVPNITPSEWVVRSPGVVNLFSMSIFNLVALMAYLTTFATAIYPRIPEQVGGGQPKIVQFVLYEDRVSDGIAAGLEVKGLRSSPLPLLWESDSMYLVSLPPAQERRWPAQINKSLIAAVLVVPSQRTADIVFPPEWFAGETSYERFATPSPVDQSSLEARPVR